MAEGGGNQSKISAARTLISNIQLLFTYRKSLHDKKYTKQPFVSSEYQIKNHPVLMWNNHKSGSGITEINYNSS